MRSRTSFSKNWPVVNSELPGEGLDLPAGEAHEGIAAADGVVEEGEGMVLGQGGEPEGELGEVHGHGVAVHAVEAALGDEAHGEEFLGLVGRDGGRPP